MYNYGLIVGRFQVLHNGHKRMIDTALSICDRVVVYIGSAQESGTKRNPFNFAVRMDMFCRLYSEEITSHRLIIEPLIDIGVGDNALWGAYIMNTFEFHYNQLPNLYITGNDENRDSWFNSEIAPGVDELILARDNISATECRGALEQDDYVRWCKSVPEVFHKEALFASYSDMYKKCKDKERNYTRL